MERTYAIASPYWFIADAAPEDPLARLEFHIEAGDYFPFLATIIGMLSEAASECIKPGSPEAIQLAAALQARKDLLHLHERYLITPRKEKISYTREKAVRF